MDIHSALTGHSIQEIEQLSSNMDTGQYKLHLADIVAQALEPINSKINELRQNKDYVERILEEGRLKATSIACENLDRVKHITGLK